MQFKIICLLFFILIVCLGCSNSTQSENNMPQATVTMTTDSLQYTLFLDIVHVNIQIKNMTDSTIVFPSCGKIRKRIDVKRGNVWSEGYPGWDSFCPAFVSFTTQLESDSSYFDMISIDTDTSGTFRVVTIYGMLSASLKDTLFSNEFLVL